MKGNWCQAYNLEHAVIMTKIKLLSIHTCITHKERPLTKIHDIRCLINSQLTIS